MSQRLLVATRKGLFDFRQQATGKWLAKPPHFMGEPVSMVLKDRFDESLYAALNLGHFGTKLHRSSDDGQSWQEVSVPSYASIAAGDGDDTDGPSLKQIWALESDGAGTLWAGTIPGGLFKSSDRGNSWQLAENLWHNPLRKQWFGGGYDEPGIHSICIDPNNNRHLTVAVSCGGIWISDDGGDNWRVSTKGMWADYTPPEQRDNSAIQDPHRMAQCPGAVNNLWVQHHNGIFRSIDGGANWAEIKATPSSFGFAVAVHPSQPDTAWFVPAVKDDLRYPVAARLVVSRTVDGGKTFTSLSRGLPQEDSYDLVYRHCLDIDSSGERLAMASTTGNLWVSENSGDRWSQLSGYLPPVYALRFV
jgi:hypothetical protein